MQWLRFALFALMLCGFAYCSEAKHGQLLAPYLAHPSNLFVISSFAQLTQLLLLSLSAMCCVAPCSEAKYGQLLAPYLADPSNLIIISSDFCHWGSRFKYTYTNSEQVSVLAMGHCGGSGAAYTVQCKHHFCTCQPSLFWRVTSAC
jgi:hypothetical protein